MRKPKRFPFLILAAIVVVVTVLLAADTVRVKVQQTSLRQNPRFYAPVVLNLGAGAELQKLAEQEGWLQVRTASGQTGWVHSTAVETRKFSLLAAGGAKTQATAGEVALAAKGFNKQVEESYRAKHKEVNFAAVESMLKLKPASAELEAFLKQGKLGGLGGAK
ncbi:MAG: SH3 domain-containing protein [Candidatus Aminicenantes bacterium]|nr:SH3 domain-containing protein [Candidatus Aminicenantes bacterium]